MPHLSEVGAVILAALLGAVAGIAGAAFALLASIRASQLAARAPLASKIHTLNATVVQLISSLGKPDYDQSMQDFQKAWNDFIVHQKILAPSDRLSLLGVIVRDAATDPSIPPDQFALMTGDAMNAAADIVALYSEHTFKWRARRAERGPVAAFAKGAVAKIKSRDIVRLVKHLTGDSDVRTLPKSTTA